MTAATPTEALERSRVDVIERIRAGIPEREFVPGTGRLIVKGKRHHLAAEGKTGKSLTMSVVMGVDVVAAGGTVAVLDRENGADEFARRLEAVLDARGADDALLEAVRGRLRYYGWPSLSLDWRDDPSYVEAFADVDLVIFDSTRSHLTPLGLKEDQSDDFARFASALIDPLTIASIATLTLDNVGHVEKGRSRGTSAKADLCDVVYVMECVTPFSSDKAGRVELRCTHARIGEVGGAWEMELGDGHYGSWRRLGAKPVKARSDVLDAVLDVLVKAGGALGSEKIGKAIRARPGNTVKIGAADLREGLSAWASDPASGVVSGPNGKGYTAVVADATIHVRASRHGPHVPTRLTRPDMADADMAQTPIETGDPPMSDAPDMARHGAHVAESHPFRGDTADTRGENGVGPAPSESHVSASDLERAERIAAEEVGS